MTIAAIGVAIKSLANDISRASLQGGASTELKARPNFLLILIWRQQQQQQQKSWEEWP